MDDVDETRPHIVGDRSLPCHRQRAQRLVVSDTPVVRACPVCRARYSISFVAEPHVSARVGLPVYRLEIAPFVDGRTRRRLEREAAFAAANPTLPFGEPLDP